LRLGAEHRKDGKLIDQPRNHLRGNFPAPHFAGLHVQVAHQLAGPVDARVRLILERIVRDIRRRNAVVADTLWRYRKLLGEMNEQIQALNLSIARESHFNLSSLQRAPIDLEASLRGFALRYPEIPTPPTTPEGGGLPE
ncbi:MAG: hypothetical protein HYZ53_02470, partial [Planctomycetes bacterium]|nr:hypothetical protein [Planctomycetota bacterium]